MTKEPLNPNSANTVFAYKWKQSGPGKPRISEVLKVAVHLRPRRIWLQVRIVKRDLDWEPWRTHLQASHELGLVEVVILPRPLVSLEEVPGFLSRSAGASHGCVRT